MRESLDGECKNSATEVRCSYVSIPKGAKRSFAIHVQAPSKDFSDRFDALTYSMTPDPKPDNNRYSARRNERSGALKALPVEVTEPIKHPTCGK